MSKYYRVLSDNARFADRWFLDDPRTESGQEIDAREFSSATRYTGVKPAVVPIYRAGRPVAFSFAAGVMPVVAAEIGEALSVLCPDDVERFPVVVGSGVGSYEIINATNREECIDESRCQVRKWGPDSFRPDKVGQYIEIEPLLIDPLRTHGRHVFRIWGFAVALIVSDEVKGVIEEVSSPGVVFLPVT